MIVNGACVYRIAQEQCCMAVVKDRLCGNGITMAREQGACERPFFDGELWESIISKVVHTASISSTFTRLQQYTQEFFQSIHGGIFFDVPDKISHPSLPPA